MHILRRLAIFPSLSVILNVGWLQLPALTPARIEPIRGRCHGPGVLGLTHCFLVALKTSPSEIRAADPGNRLFQSLENVHLGVKQPIAFGRKTQRSYFVQPFQRVGFSRIARNSGNNTDWSGALLDGFLQHFQYSSRRCPRGSNVDFLRRSQMFLKADLKFFLFGKKHLSISLYTYCCSSKV